MINTATPKRNIIYSALLTTSAISAPLSLMFIQNILRIREKHSANTECTSKE